MILFTRRSLISNASPASACPALLLTMVRSVAPLSSRAWMSSIGRPASPNPPISTVEPSVIFATAAAAVSTILVISFPLLSGVFVFNHHGNTLANANTQCGQTPAAVFSFQATCQCPQYARTGCTQRVAHCDGAALGVNTFIVQGDTAGVLVNQNLRGNCFIEFYRAYLIPGAPGAFQRQVGRWYWCFP